MRLRPCWIGLFLATIAASPIYKSNGVASATEAPSEVSTQSPSQELSQHLSTEASPSLVMKDEAFASRFMRDRSFWYLPGPNGQYTLFYLREPTDQEPSREALQRWGIPLDTKLVVDQILEPSFVVDTLERLNRTTASYRNDEQYIISANSVMSIMRQDPPDQALLQIFNDIYDNSYGTDERLHNLKDIGVRNGFQGFDWTMFSFAEGQALDDYYGFIMACYVPTVERVEQSLRTAALAIHEWDETTETLLGHLSLALIRPLALARHALKLRLRDLEGSKGASGVKARGRSSR